MTGNNDCGDYDNIPLVANGVHDRKYGLFAYYNGLCEGCFGVHIYIL